MCLAGVASFAVQVAVPCRAGACGVLTNAPRLDRLLVRLKPPVHLHRCMLRSVRGQAVRAMSPAGAGLGCDRFVKLVPSGMFGIAFRPPSGGWRLCVANSLKMAELHSIPTSRAGACSQASFAACLGTCDREWTESPWLRSQVGALPALGVHGELRRRFIRSATSVQTARHSSASNCGRTDIARSSRMPARSASACN